MSDLIERRLINESFAEMIENVNEQNRISKMSEEEEHEFEDEVTEYKKTWDIAGNDSYIQEQIAEKIEELVYDENNVVSRIQVLRAILYALDILYIDDEISAPDENGEYARWDSIYKEVIKKIEQLNYADFTRLYENTYNLYDLFANKQCVNVIIEKISNMTIAEFAYFLLSIDYAVLNYNEEIFNACKIKIKNEDSALLYDAYNHIHMPGEMEEIPATKNLFKIDELYPSKFNGILNMMYYKSLSFYDRKEFEKGLEHSEYYNNYIRQLAKLTPKEFVMYLLKNIYPFELCKDAGSCFKFCLPEEQKILSSKISELSNQDIIVLLEQYFPVLGNEELWDKNIKTIQTSSIKEVVEKLESSYSFYVYFIMKETVKRKLISPNFERQYSDEEIDIALDYAQLYDEINESDKFFVDFFSFDYDFNVNDETEKNEKKLKILEDVIKDGDDTIKDDLKVYELFDRFANLTENQFCQFVNWYNKKVSANEVVDLSSQAVFINYIKKRIISLPTKYANFFEINPTGCLNDIMELKVEELPILNIEERDL